MFFSAALEKRCWNGCNTKDERRIPPGGSFCALQGERVSAPRARPGVKPKLCLNRRRVHQSSRRKASYSAPQPGRELASTKTRAGGLGRPHPTQKAQAIACAQASERRAYHARALSPRKPGRRGVPRPRRPRPKRSDHSKGYPAGIQFASTKLDARPAPTCTAEERSRIKAQCLRCLDVHCKRTKLLIGTMPEKRRK